jgi:hypothetical protein
MSEIKDLAKTIREENEKTRAQTERIANGEGPYAKETIVAAKASLKKQEEQRALAKKSLNISERRMVKAEKLNDQIKAQEQIMAKQRAALEESGIDAENSKKFQKEQLKLEKLKAKRDSTTGAAAAEDENKRKFRETRTGKVLLGIKSGIFGMSKSLGGLVKDKVKAGVSSIFGLLKKFALGGLALAAIAFLNSPKFDELLKFIREKVIPRIGPLLENLKTLFNDVMETFDKFLDDPDLKKAMESFNKGDFIEGIKSLGVSIFKKDGLVDNLLTNLTNSILRVMGKSKLNNTVFRALEKFSFRVTNLLIDTINRFIMMIPEPLRPKLLNKIDPETGKEILSDEDKREIKREKEIEKRIKEKPEIAKLEKEVAAMPDKTEEGLVNMEKIKAQKKVDDAKDVIVKQVDKTITMSEESKKLLSRLKAQVRPGKDLDKLIDGSIKRQQQFLKVQKRKLEGGSKLSGTELRVDAIKRLEETIKDLKRAKDGGGGGVVSNSGNTQQNNVDNSRSVQIPLHPLQQQSFVISSLNAAAGIF